MVLKVAPYVGAWVETLSASDAEDKKGVAPYVGAWVETWSWYKNVERRRSHLTWVRGLKLLLL